MAGASSLVCRQSNSLLAMPGLDPGIHRSSQDFSKRMDHRVKPGDDVLSLHFVLGTYCDAFTR